MHLHACVYKYVNCGLSKITPNSLNANLYNQPGRPVQLYGSSLYRDIKGSLIQQCCIINQVNNADSAA